jgi:hypothetical protein
MAALILNFDSGGDLWQTIKLFPLSASLMA